MAANAHGARRPVEEGHYQPSGRAGTNRLIPPLCPNEAYWPQSKLGATLLSALLLPGETD
jgi:hypothetical protein